jgi:hypothetical protein
VCQAIRDEFDAWRTRRLDAVELDYLFVDGSHFKMHAGTRAEPVLAAWGITTAGKPVLVGLDAAGNEGNDAWDDFLDELNQRGLRPPLLVISDGAAGLVGALDRQLARSLRQRCLIHRSRKELSRHFRYLRSLMWYGDHGGGHVSAWLPVRGVVAAPERAAAAFGGGCRGPVARSWWGARCGPGRRDERDHGAPWGGGVGGG